MRIASSERIWPSLKNQYTLPFWRDFKKEMRFPTLFCYKEEEVEVSRGQGITYLSFRFENN
jgi:hypothetical protein